MCNIEARARELKRDLQQPVLLLFDTCAYDSRLSFAPPGLSPVIQHESEAAATRPLRIAVHW